MSMRNKLCIMKRLLTNVRQIHSSSIIRSNGSYDGPGRTTVNIINTGESSRILIDKCMPIGFRFSNNSLLVGPLAIFPRTILCWNVASGMDINEASLSLFTSLEPKLDILILGLEAAYDYRWILETKKLLNKYKISAEILPVEQACAVYNFVSQDGRYAAAGLVPPKLKEMHLYKKLKSDLDNMQKMKEIESH